MNYQSQLLAQDMVRRGGYLPLEIYNQIKEDVDEQMGTFYWDDTEKGMMASHSMPYKGNDELCVRSLRVYLNLDPGQETFDDQVINTLGRGFCYLQVIDPEVRADALRALNAWPMIEELFQFFEQKLSSFYVEEVFTSGERKYAHIKPGFLLGDKKSPVPFYLQCNSCGKTKTLQFWVSHRAHHDLNLHAPGCNRSRREVICSPKYDRDLVIRVGGLFRKLTSSVSDKSPSRSKRARRSVSDSQVHDDKQVLNFTKSIKGDGIEPDMTRDLYSVPKPQEIETMADHISNHKPGDVFPYFSVVGNEEETKEGRLSRLRAYRSPYGKENKPEMRINGVILDEIEGTILVQQLKEHVDETKLSRAQSKQNKKFKPLDETTFKKSYIMISRITGEYVPLMSSTADYTELYFTLEDGRLLDNQTIVQSNKLPTNQNGVFELSCDYCINVKDIKQLSLKYFLSRPIMKEGFQWGSISITIRMSESDTPFLIPKVEAMAIVRTPYTTLEEQTKDPDHADVVYTSGQIKKFQEMYKAGEIMDIDEAKKERTKKSSYSKSSIRGATKGEQGPTHLSNQDGWEHMKGMVKPRLAEGEASISAPSEEEDDIQVSQLTKEQYEREQERLRKQFEDRHSESTEDIPDEEAVRSISPSSDNNYRSIGEVTPPKHKGKKLRFDDDEGEDLQKPNTKNVYQFD